VILRIDVVYANWSYTPSLARFYSLESDTRHNGQIHPQWDQVRLGQGETFSNYGSDRIRCQDLINVQFTDPHSLQNYI